MKNTFSKSRLQLVTSFTHSLMAAGIILALAPQAWAACTYKVTNNWGGGFTGEIKVTNDTSQTITGWSVSWKESGGTVTNAWNAVLAGSNPYTATAAGWNGTLAPQASATFGFQANGTVGAPKVTGSLCGTAASSISPVQSSSKSSTSSLQIPNSSSSVKSSVATSISKSSAAASSLAAERSWIFEESAVGFCGNSGVIASNHSGYTGVGFVDSENVIGASINWSISAGSAKTYAVKIRFANGSAATRRASILVNDSTIQSVDFPSNNNWAQWQTVTINVPLKAGANSFKTVAETSDGLANIDNISVTGNGITPAACPTTPTTADCNSITNQPILRVAADGSGQYRTVQAALNTLSNSNTTPTQIRIKPGTYREKLTITKPLVTFCGETGKTTSTILTYNDGASTLKADGTAIGTSGSASVTLKANDVSMENITIENSFGVGSQAVALLAQGQRLQFRSCRLLGNQDTLYTHSGTQYYRNCHIQGTVDFIFGAATAVFDNNTIHSVGGGSALTAPSTEQAVPYGLVFLGGKVTASASVNKGSVALGRNWRPYGAAAYIRTELGQHISAVGWVKMSENTLDTARFSEYLTTGAGANTSARAPQSKQLTTAQAATYTISNIFGAWTPSYSK